MNKISMDSLVGIKYDDRSMDFSTLIKRSGFERALFLFNDNVREHQTCKQGAGNAVIRPFNRYSGISFPQSAGIPTGFYRSGFNNLEEAKSSIDDSFDEITELLKTGLYNLLVYSIEDYENPIIGTGIFKVDMDVRKYITKKIFDLCSDCGYVYYSSKYGTGPGFKNINQMNLPF